MAMSLVILSGSGRLAVHLIIFPPDKEKKLGSEALHLSVYEFKLFDWID